jgi:hypothetical protein
MPRRLTLSGGVCSLAQNGVIVIEAEDSQSLWFIAQEMQAALQSVGLHWSIIAGRSGAANRMALILNLTHGSALHDQGYSLTVTPERIDATAATPVGLFYAVQTLRQLVQLCGQRLPTLRCTDWPDFPNRGVMLDVSRSKVPTMTTLYSMVDLLASWKINQLQLYTEHTFAYGNHAEVWADASPLTGEEILALDAYCRARFIELVPNQNTFGHMTPWLIHERYRDLAEAPDGCDTRWGRYDVPLSLNPGDPRSLELVRSMLDELLPHFSSRQVNVGCDETIDLGLGRSKDAVAERGAGRVYLDFVLKVYQDVQRRGRVMQFWGDIIMEHPELTPELPANAIALEWGYQADHPFDAHGALFAASGIPFYVCPGTSSWNSIVGRTDNAFGNLRNAAANGRKYGAVGYLITDWGDNGHWQPLSVSALPLAYGAGLAWSYEHNVDADVCASVDAFFFQNNARQMARIAHDLGKVDNLLGIQIHNRSGLFSILLVRPNELVQRVPAEVDLSALPGRLAEAEAEIDRLAARLAEVEMGCVDAGLIHREYQWGMGMLRHACRRGRWVLAGGNVGDETAQALLVDAQRLIAEYGAIWQARFRPGGYEKSVSGLRRLCVDYGGEE